MNFTTRQDRRCRVFAGFIGLSLGIGLSGLLAYILFGSKASLPSARLITAGTLPRSAVGEPDAAKRDEQARRATEGVLDGLFKKDSAALASFCGTPFLWGRFDRHRVIENPAEIQHCLSEELLQGWEPLMYGPERSLNSPLSPSAFFDRYADYLGSMPRLKEALDAIHLKEFDRMVVDEHRGMLIAVRANAESSRVIAIVLGGFKPPLFKLTRNLIYGRKFGAALTLDVIQPKAGGNRAAVLELIGDTFVSHPPLIGTSLHAREQGLLERGYTIIYVTHSSVPRHPISEIVGDVRRAVRFIRYHAAQLDLDPDRLAILGGSAAGYLALMAGTSDDNAQPFPPAYDPVREFDLASDPVESVSGKATTIVAYFPVTDWVNFGETDKTVFDYKPFPSIGILDLYDYNDKTKGFTRISDRTEQLRGLKALSPVNRVGRGFPPTLLFHGAKDTNVPVQQSESMFRALKAAGADVKLVVKANEKHGWPDNAADQKTLVEWLDRRLLRK